LAQSIDLDVRSETRHFRVDSIYKMPWPMPVELARGVWRVNMVIDIHCHYIPERYFEFIENEKSFDVCRKSTNGEEIEVKVGSLKFGLNKVFFDIKRQIERMQLLSIDQTILSLATPLISYSVPVDIAVQAARIFNDELADIKTRFPGRFNGWAFLPMQSPSMAAQELRRAVVELGLQGGHIASNINGRYLDKPEYTPIFEEATDLDVPLFVHPTNPPGRERMETYELVVVSGYLFDTTLNIFNMIFGRLLDKYPTIKLCCAHAGGFALLLRGRMQREVDTNPSLASTINRPVAEYLKKLYYDTVCFEKGYLKYAVDVVGADRLVLGSDGPFPLGEPDPVNFIKQAFGDNEVGRGILYQNAAVMFGSDDRAGSPVS